MRKDGERISDNSKKAPQRVAHRLEEMMGVKSVM